MPTSKLMHYVKITKLLMENNNQTINQINSFFADHTPTKLRKDLDFLSENKILTKTPTGENQRYTIAKQGIGLLTFFKIRPSKSSIKLKS